ncbi:MAG: EpsI family protein, partial [Anaerolineae bacterium]|nr:EpsI family protein [Anaerolineae bacterium]
VSFPMQLFSAKSATMLMGLVGLPVSRDGVDIHLPRYTFSVGVPCSGMNSLVALLALAALAAYLLSGPSWKRWVLFGTGVPLALLANVLRIACILSIAVIWGAKAAEGFFHGFSGIVVFLFATLGLVATGRALGLRYGSSAAQEPAGAAIMGERAAERGDSPDTVPRKTRGAGRWRLYAAPLVLLLVTGGLVAVCRVGEGAGIVRQVDFSQVPTQAAGWEGRDLGPLDEVSQDMLRPEAYMGRLYVRGDGYPVDVTVVCGHAKETFHSPGFCLLGGGWNITRKARRTIDFGGAEDPVQANEFHLQRQEERRVVLYWYASRGETTPSWVAFQYRLLRNRLLRRPTRGALVRVTAPMGGSDEAASQAAAELIRELYPSLREAVRL